ncbi:hypothetical protein A2303_03020 [Candidatus Falkowbacteria bacterium RIFOXYB2_FULL_47_14]|uniref:Uncharacterized protein n=1 Tax=Candidatus Falkowbacteria bacterium RIFOXYA2_FULL_47_19 TaxID=1797994 RepID=A0A1F5SF17_9BACT|nr:MAG: hypothetical protein A2227_07950 [Candidatus Falkowbacteria bacterium RIFOXYA2_FULL_47_19]OGF36355.1 MAG: hypothetical protein A2468_01645 [Candidatus Falkowbacteria bacterium RIFOXYC2_FULL_46_15]OGF43328.1 MAG: hypothetical protein A2303_03020 [Candidatus Falkowbacteria bacterium RIFOXYB2_FULL_47_14]
MFKKKNNNFLLAIFVLTLIILSAGSIFLFLIRKTDLAKNGLPPVNPADTVNTSTEAAESVPLKAEREECESEDAAANDVCYAEAAVKDAAIELCERIGDKNALDQCLDNILNMSPEAKCDDLKSDDSKKSCFVMAAVRDGNPDYCSRFSDKDRCLMMMAEKKMDVGICGNDIASDEIRDLCYSSLAEKKSDIDICREIRGADLRDICYSQAFAWEDNSGFCAMIENVDLRNNCFFVGAVSKTDAGMCAKIEEGGEAGISSNDCYSNLAFNAGDSGYCDYLEDAGNKEACVAQVSRKK